MSATFTLIGREAIDFCERHRLQPWKHADSTDVEGRPVTGAEARAICRQDPAQVHVCLYDLEPRAAQLWAVSGPAWLRLDNLDPDERQLAAISPGGSTRWARFSLPNRPCQPVGFYNSGAPSASWQMVNLSGASSGRSKTVAGHLSLAKQRRRDSGKRSTPARRVTGSESPKPPFHLPEVVTFGEAAPLSCAPSPMVQSEIGQQLGLVRLTLAVRRAFIASPRLRCSTVFSICPRHPRTEVESDGHCYPIK